MGRYARITDPGLVYHVIKRGNNRDVIFAEHEDYQHYLNNLQRYKKKYGFKLFAYCLMTNHVHLLIKVEAGATISKIMQSVTVAHTRYYNYVYQRCGHVWQGRFHSPLVSEDGHMLNVMRYIEQNPLRAKMVAQLGEYQWSSYLLNIRQKESVIIDRDENVVFQSLGKDWQTRVENYKNFVNIGVNEDEVKAIQDSTRKGNNYISEKFQGQINALIPNKRRRGRPRSNAYVN